MEIPRQFITLVFAMGCALSSFAGMDPPSTSPTPRAGTLAAIASGRSLNRADGVEAIVITDDNLSQFADGAVITLMTSTAAEFSEITISDGVDPKTREKWRKKVLAQSNVIARLEAKRASIEDEINRLERGRLDARTLDRVARAEARLEAADSELRRERLELSRIVRDARKEGAQPGWFR